MCGIAGLTVAPSARIDIPSVAEQMRAKLGHRGPDDQGLFVTRDGGCAFAHTRLSILDLSSAGHQPMITGDGRYVIVFNGEIYNYRELREELAAGSGKRSWCSNTDTEVVLRAYARWGRECLEHLRGMFAFALWDVEREELFLARDPFGIKPLYYYAANDRFAFASEMRALLASDLFPRRLSSQGLSSYLQFGSAQDPLTMIDGVRALLPGHYLIVPRAGKKLQINESAYADYLTQDNSSPAISDRREAVAELRQILEESLRQHLVSDVPLGVFLSGGIDSGALVALLNRVAPDNLKTFSVIFAESDFSEAAHARMIANAFNTDHREILLSEAGLLDLLPRALQDMDRPTMDGINTYVISKAVKEAGVTVALSGLGGDELFAGYPSFRRAEQLQRLAFVPQSLRTSVSNLGRVLLNGSTRRRKFWDMIASDCSPCSVYAISRQLYGPAEIARLLPDCADIPSFDSCSSPADAVNVIAMHELAGYMSNTLLRDTDQMSMAHSLEVRVPFIDPVVVKYVLGLPGKWKTDHHRPKPLLLDALGELLPREVWRRPKMGFTLPFQRWLRAALEPELDQVFLNDDGLSALGLSAPAVRHVWRAFKCNPQDEPWSRPWALYVLQKWCKENNVTAG
jgi:asparagine synthase (glutamine-hydrolysing)